MPSRRFSQKFSFLHVGLLLLVCTHFIVPQNAVGGSKEPASNREVQISFIPYAFEQYGTKYAKNGFVAESQLNRYSFASAELRMGYEREPLQLSLGIKPSRYYSDEALEYPELSDFRYQSVRLKRGYQGLALAPSATFFFKESISFSSKIEYEAREAIEPLRGVKSDRLSYDLFFGFEKNSDKIGIGSVRVKETSLGEGAPSYDEQSVNITAHVLIENLHNDFDLHFSKIKRDEVLDFQDTDYTEQSGTNKIFFRGRKITPEFTIDFITRSLKLKQLEDFNFAQANRVTYGLKTTPELGSFGVQIEAQYKVFRSLNKIYTLNGQNLFLYADGSSNTVLTTLSYSPFSWLYIRYKGNQEEFSFYKIHRKNDFQLGSFILPHRLFVQSLFAELSHTF